MESQRPVEPPLVFHIIVLLKVHEAGDVEEIRDLLVQAARMSREEPGCVRFEVYHCASDPQTFILNEWWESEQAWKDHREREAVQTIYLPKVLSRADRVPYVSELVG